MNIMRIVRGFWKNCEGNLAKFSLNFQDITIFGERHANFGEVLENMREII